MNTHQAGNERRAREIFLAGLDKADTAIRAAFIEGACGGDVSLRSAVEALFANHLEDSFLEQGPATVLSEGGGHSRVTAEVPGMMIGRYKLLQKIGEGGCGVVYMAEQEEPVRRRVALKVIKLGMDTKSVIARFEAERQALAMMDHPNIAKVLDGGATDTGRPYFVMELVRGVKITEYCDQHKLQPRQRLELFVKVCQAIQHAHQKGIIHRDIKPSNILVTVNDGVAVPKVIDFGIAKAIEGRLTNNTLFTAFEQFIGTPAYMSPEQAVLTSLDIDTRSDIYSLGVLLYELLTGKTPFDPTELMKAGLDELRRTIRDQEPPRPSTRLTQDLVAAGVNRDSGLPDVSGGAEAGRQLQDLVALLRGDLDWIVMKCLEKDRQRRYETANGLAADIERHLHHEPIVARPPSAAYRFQKLVRRNKLAFAAAGAVAAALVIGIAVSTWQAVVATRARQVAETARAAESQEHSIAITERNRAQAEAARAEQAQRTAERNAYAATMTAAQADWDNANISHLHQILNETSTYPDKGFEWYYWQRMIRSELLSMREHDAAVTSVCFSPDGSRVASGSMDRTVRVWDAASGQTLLKPPRQSEEVLSLAFSVDGRRLLTVSNDGLVRIFDARSAEELRVFPGRAAALSPDGRALFIASPGGALRLLDSSSGRELWDLGEQEAAVRTLAFSSDGSKILSAALGGSFRTWKWDGTSKPTLLWEQPGPGWERTTEARPAAFSSDGQRIVIGGRDRIVRILDADDGRELKSFTGHAEQVTAVAFSPDGGRLASGSLDHTIKVWDVDAGEARFTLRGHTARVLSLAFSPDGRRLASASDDRTVKVWDSLNPAFPRLPGVAASRVNFSRFSPIIPEHRNWGIISTNALQLVRFSPDGRHILTAMKDNTARIWDATTLTEIRVLRGHTYILSHANFAPDGKLISTGSLDGSLRLWNAGSGEQLRVWREPWGYPGWSRITQDGQHLLSAMSDGFIRIWDLTKEGKPRLWRAHEGEEGTFTAEYSPDEQRIATCGAGGVVKVWDARTGQQLMSLRGHTGIVVPLVFSPDGKKIATGGRDLTIRVWDAVEGRELLTIRGHSAEINDVNFSPDGRRLVSAGYDKTVRIWDAIDGRELLTLRGNSDYHMAAIFSPDGNRVACAGDFPFFETWEIATADQVSHWREEDECVSKRWAAWGEQAAAHENAARAGLIKSWLILAPIIPGSNGKGLGQLLRDEQLVAEARLRPRPEDSMRLGAQELRWQKAHFEDGVIDFNRFVGTGETRAVAGYAVCYVRSSKACRGLRLKVGSDDASRVYLNGRLLHDYPFGGALVIDRDTVPGADLEPGVNVVVFKVMNDVGPWQGALRFVDEQDSPVQGLEFTSSPD